MILSVAELSRHPVLTYVAIENNANNKEAIKCYQNIHFILFMC